MWTAAVLSLLCHALVAQCSDEANAIAELRRSSLSEVEAMKTRVAELEGALRKERSAEERLKAKISLLEIGLREEVESVSPGSSDIVATGKVAIADGFADGHLHLQRTSRGQTSLLQEKGAPEPEPTGSDIFKGAEEESSRMEDQIDLVNNQLGNVKTMIKYNEELKKKLEGDLHVMTVLSEADEEAIKIAKKGEEQSILNVATSFKAAAEAAKEKLEEAADDEEEEDEEKKEQQEKEQKEVKNRLNEENEEDQKIEKNGASKEQEDANEKKKDDADK